VKQIRRFKIQSIFVLLLLVQASCIKKTIKIPEEQRLLPAKTAMRADLFKGLEEKSKKIQTMQGKMAIVLSGGGPKSGVLTQYHETTAVVVVNRPNFIHLKVQLPIILTTVADMVADGIQYKIWIPFKNQFMTGDAKAPVTAKGTVADLRPQQFMEGLFVDIGPYLNKPQVKYLFEEAVEGRRSYYVFSFIDVSGEEAQLLEKVWIDRSDDLQVGRKQLFGKDGRIESDVEYSNYHSEDGIPFPQVIVLHLPVQDYTVRMTFQKTAFNEKLAENSFALEKPEGSEQVQLEK
jgi:outer membrane lipoprotein-sorting protein